MATEAELRILLITQRKGQDAFKDLLGDLGRTEKAAGGASGALGGIGKTVGGLGGLFAAPVKGLGSLLDGLGKVGMAGFGLGAVAGAVQGIGSALLSPIGAASDLNESMSKTQVVFGSAAGDIARFAQTSASALGLTKNEALAAAGNLGNMFTSMGLTDAASADLSKQMVQMAADFGSFNNLPVPEALEKIRAGLTGEAEPLRSMGVLLNEASVKAKAMEMGLADARGELSESAKVQARAALIMEQGAKAQGDFARTSTGLANSQRIISAAFGDLTAEIGGRLLPVVAPLVSNFAQALPGAIQMALPFLDRIGEGLGGVSGVLTDFLLPHLTDLGAAVQAVFQGDFQAAVSLLTTKILPRLRDFGADVLGWIQEQLPKLGRALGEWTAELVAFVAPAIPPLLRELGGLARGVLKWIADQAPPLLKQFTEEWAPTAINWLVKAGKDIVPKLGAFVGDLLDWVTEQGPPLARKFLAEWVPAAIGWVAKAAVDILPELLALVVGIGGWILTTGVPKLAAFALEMGKAIVGGIIDGLANLGSRLADALGSAIRSIRIDLGPFHLSASGFRIDAPTFAPIAMPAVPSGGSGFSALMLGLGGATSMQASGGGGAPSTGVPGGDAAVAHAVQTASDWHSTFNFEKNLGRSEEDARKIADAAAAQKRQAGGPVWPGALFTVGESGREIFAPTTHGTILPADVTRMLLGTGGGPSGGWTGRASPAGPAVAQVTLQVDGATMARATAPLYQDEQNRLVRLRVV